MIPQPSKAALVPFVSVQNMMALVHDIGLETVLCQLTEVVEADYRRWPAFEKCARLASHSKLGVIELMPTSDGVNYSFKYVNGHPANTRTGLQTVTALGLLAEVATGYPVLRCEMTLLTALRTAATSAMATRLLAPKGADTLALIGTGAQAVFQALALKVVYGVGTVRLYDIDPAATQLCAAHLRAKGITAVECESGQSAVQGAQVITTCTADKQHATILTDNMVGAGVHINALGGDCPGKTELHRDILLRSAIFVEFAEQTRIEGEIQQLAGDHPVTEIADVLSGQAPGRQSDRQITLFDGVGFAIEDFSALKWVRGAIATNPQFDLLDLLADPDEPRDLYGMLMRAKVD
ncbi:MAG: ornithine cyclodeaminase [Devosia sp.]|nr:ornithine cyclodeaminase [Devosia sp.]